MGRIEVDLESPDAVVVWPLHEVERRKLQNEGYGRRSQDLRRDDDVDDRRDADRLQPVAPDDEEVPEERDEGRQEERVKADEDVDEDHEEAAKELADVVLHREQELLDHHEHLQRRQVGLWLMTWINRNVTCSQLSLLQGL